MNSEQSQSIVQKSLRMVTGGVKLFAFMMLFDIWHTLRAGTGLPPEVMQLVMFVLIAVMFLTATAALGIRLEEGPNVQ